MADTEVLIAGAGPTGLVLALWLSKLGVKVRIVDRMDLPGATSRALAVQARTLELYGQLDLADAVMAAAHRVPAINLWVKGRRATRLPFIAIGEGLTPYPFVAIFPQDEHEALLIQRLAQFGVDVQRGTEVVAIREDGTRVVAELRTANGGRETCEAAYIAGCDGAHSIVRQTIGASFAGGTYHQTFYVADVDLAGPTADGELHIDLDEADFLAVFPMKGQGRARLVGTVRGERALAATELAIADVSDRAIQNLKVTVRTVNWFSTYRVHHRVTDHFRKGRAFILGDAAHIHSPAGGQGMNTGIGDAINLAWKLAAVIAGRAPDTLLDTYEAERIGFARALVHTTDRLFTLATATGALADTLRLRVVPFVAPKVLALGQARAALFRGVSQIRIHYRRSPLSQGRAGKVRGGDRLPWVKADGADNFASLAAPVWQAHVYGEAQPALSAWCAEHGLPLQAFAWSAAHQTAGLARGAVYLIRPDTYVALADPSGVPEAIEAYCAARGLTLASEPALQADRRP